MRCRECIQDGRPDCYHEVIADYRPAKWFRVITFFLFALPFLGLPDVVRGAGRLWEYWVNGEDVV